jgi:hypothetical protein
MKPLLFLDIDGVLNSVAHYKRRFEKHGHVVGHEIETLDVAAVKRLQTIVERSGCLIVISSTWRKIYPLGAIVKALQTQGYDGNPPVVGMTPVINAFCEHRRGREVARFLESYGRFTGTDPNYVCVDDDSDFFKDQNLVQCDNEYGLTDEDVERIVTMLSA